jgi:hypothetical protein
MLENAEVDHHKLYFGLAKCIASVPQEFHADLCREFRINPKDVEASALSSHHSNTEAG